MKIFFAGAATFVTILGYIPYFRDLFRRKTQPHIYTWLIWAITLGTAVVALLYGGGELGSVSLIAGFLFVVVVFFFSFKYGTKNITKSDTIMLVLALLAIIIWWQLDSPLWAVIVISFVDGMGFVPTFRKTYVDPNSETLSFWILIALSNILAMFANTQYNFLTMTYLGTMALGNIIVITIILSRKKTIPVGG